MASAERPAAFVWGGKPLVTIGELNDAMYAIYKRGDQAEADRFMAEYRAYTEHADANIGYLTGYYGAKDAEAMRVMFQADHPIFGMKSPTFEEAFDAGFLGAMGVERDA